ncbi:hypothetical protein ABIA69_002185 [Lysinibacillus parviboronicapiens]|uniref:Uncharacterized protein n=1 Tax=Lysinibacillus parviboronicapiens TaxID=436516 RepID=A0ABV2PJE0_9BACI
MTNPPVVSWYEGTNELASKVNNTVNYGTVDADSESPHKTFYIWNNREGKSDCSKMEEVTFTTRDREGGPGDSVGKVVEAVRDNWFHVRVDTLNETKFTPVGKGGTANPLGTKDLGTNGTTTNKNAKNASVWSKNTILVLDTYIQPTVANGFIYKVVKAGTTDITEPSWVKVEGNLVPDNDIEYTAIKIDKTPAAKEILGLAHDTLDDGSNADFAGGNFVKVTVYADVPITASAGKNLLVQRVSYRYV